jgi:putative transposase
LIDYERLQALFGTDSYDQLRTTHKGWVEEQLQGAGKKRQDEWTDSIAVGSKVFIENVKAQLGFRAKGRDVKEADEGYQLRENLSSYKALFGVENEDIDLKNTYLWNEKSE